MNAADKVGVLAIPATFYDDHAARCLPTPTAIKRSGSRVYVHADDPSIASLLSDAEYYANAENMDECSRIYVESARRTVAAIGARHV